MWSLKSMERIPLDDADKMMMKQGDDVTHYDQSPITRIQRGSA